MVDYMLMYKNDEEADEVKKDDFIKKCWENRWIKRDGYLLRYEVDWPTLRRFKFFKIEKEKE